MPSDNVAALRAEMAAQVAEIGPVLEGFRDYVRIASEGEEDMKAAAQTQVESLQRRLDRIAEVVTTLDALEHDGFPDVPPLEVPPGVLAKFQANDVTIAAALARVRAFEAAAAQFNIGTGIPKP